MAYIAHARDLIQSKLAGEDTVDLEQRATVLKLARLGHEQCAVAWRDYAQLDPVDARQVAKYVDGTLTKAGGQTQAADPEALQRAMLAEWANDADPELRTSARAALASLEGAR